MDKATQFVDSFKKVSDMLSDNKSKWVSYAVIVYARDTNTKTDEFPDWVVKTHIFQTTTPYDRKSIRQFVDETFVRPQ